MSTMARVSAGEVEGSYLADGLTLRSWLLTTDHKRIALLYLGSITFFFFIGGLAAALVRLNLIVPEGLLGSAEAYNRLFTMHGVIMVWFFLVPAVPVTLGNFLIPLMLGARDLAFPRLNLFSWYLFIAGGAVTLWALFVGGLDTGWTLYTPLSTAYSKSHVVLAAVGIFISGFSSIATGLNFIVTIHRLRAPGLSWYRMPVFLWSLYSLSVLLVLATPVLAITLLLLTAERLFHIGVFDPAIGGDPLLFQHLFWFYSHPAVYMMILPGFGVVSEIIPTFSRKSIFGYKFIVWASVSIADHQFLRLGPSHVRGGHLGVFRGALFDFELSGRGTVGHQGVQLAGYHAQGLHPLRCAHAVRVGIHRLVHDWRIDRIVGGRSRRGCAFDPNLFCSRTFPLHHGGRYGVRFFRRLAFLVA